MQTEYDRQINLASSNANPLSRARLQQDITRLHNDGLSSQQVADKLKIPASHVGTIYQQNGWAKPAPGKPHRLSPPASQVDNVAHYASSMIKGGYNEAEIAAHVRLQVPELRRRIAAAGL